MSDAALREMRERLPAWLRGGRSYNAGLDGAVAGMAPVSEGAVVDGVVCRAGPTAYDVVVRVPPGRDIVCAVGGIQLSGVAGTVASAIPQPGSQVVVYIPANSTVGIVIAAMPGGTGASGEPQGGVLHTLRPWEHEGGASERTEPAFAKIRDAKRDPLRGFFPDHRPFELMAGEFAMVNDQGAGLGVTALSAGVRAGAKSRVTCSVPDDKVTVVAGHLDTQTDVGRAQEFNDEGLLTRESYVSQYQHEALGADALGEDVCAAGTATPYQDGSVTARLKAAVALLMPRKRIQSFAGYLGGVFSVFFADPAKRHVLGAAGADKGLLRANVSPDGRLTVNAAGGIAITRDDAIPVPVRKRFPWDPEGDAPDGKPHKGEGPFRFPADHGARAVCLADAEAFREKGQYAPLLNHPKDFSVPESDAAPALDDTVDDVSGTKAEFSANKGRKAGIFVEPDGSVVIRDAWGAEIVMSGGDITMSAPGRIVNAPGGTFLVAAGHDAVIHAEESVDVVAKNRDARVYAERNLHLTAEASKGSGGSVLLRSGAKAFGGSWEGRGEASRGAGVFISAPDSGVLVEGRRVFADGAESLALSARGRDGEGAGVVAVAAGTVRMAADDGASITCGESSIVRVGSSSVLIGGRNASVITDSGFSVTKGRKAMLQLWSADGETYPYSSATTEAAANTSAAGLAAVPPVAAQDRGKVRFTFRAAGEYAAGGAAPSGFFAPAWGDGAGGFVRLFAPAPRGKPPEVEGTLPYPGEGANMCLLELSSPVNRGGGGGKKKFAERTAVPEVAVKDLSEYPKAPHA